MALEKEKALLLALADENEGLITVDAVLDAARDEDSPLHRHFEWDDSKAAENHRRWQARTLIARCRITLESRPDTLVRAFVSLPSDRVAKRGYRMMVDVMQDQDQRAELMQDMRARLAYWTQQSAMLDAPVRKALENLSTAVGQATATHQTAA